MFDHTTGLRVEWAKSRARALRWSEEVILLCEEMRRVLWFLQWKSQWWLTQAHLGDNAREDVREGLIAYSCKQAAILDQLGKHFASIWYPFLVAHGIAIEWPEEYLKEGSSGVEEAVEESVAEDDGVLEMDDEMFD